MSKKQPFEVYDTWDNPYAVRYFEVRDKALLWKRVAIAMSIVNIVLLGVVLL